MATTEEMNALIYEYMGNPRPICKDVNGNDFDMDFTPIYHTSWDALMPVWDKLRGELEAIKSVDVQVRKNNIAINLYNANITEAHRLIYEAITWLNQNKGK